MQNRVDYGQHFILDGTEPGVQVAVDPPARYASVDCLDRNERSMSRRHGMYVTKLDDSQHEAWERTHTTFRPIPKMSWIKHPLASRAGIESESPKEPWIFRLVRSPFVIFGGSASNIGATESERARRLR